MKWLPVLVGVMLVGAIGGFAYFVYRMTVHASEVVHNAPVRGRFDSTNDGLGSWHLAPARCIAGSELGFDGVAFGFAAGSPVDQIRFDASREGDNVIEVRLADQAGTVYRVREKDCDEITGKLVRHHVEFNKRPMTRLEGSIHFACPDQGLSGEAHVDGCLPETP